MSVGDSTSPPQPIKRIISRAHLQVFLDSDAHADLVAFITETNESAVGVKLTEPIEISPAILGILAVLDGVDQLITDTPPVDNGKSRFGNPAFKDFFDKQQQATPQLHKLIPALAPQHISELSAYFSESWGNRIRVDYGSGMELNFICWLLILRKLGVITQDDNKALVMKVFWKYMMVTRRLQSEYWLEPAGSHGAQGLDDYHFAVFIYGSAQLRGHKHLRPKAIHDQDLLDEFSNDYMYLSYIRYINSIKTASLRWHSPMLDDISSVKTWDKVNSGMLKMYQAEVLAKLPVAQHFLFGEHLPYPADALAKLEGEDGHAHGEEGVTTDAHGHLHVRGEGFGDCCGIPIPSAFAAAEERRKAGGRGFAEGVVRIPFD